MGWLCKLVGHAPLTEAGWCGGVGYARVSGSVTDGIGTVHYYLKAECPRCGEEYRICNVHEESHKAPNAEVTSRPPTGD